MTNTFKINNIFITFYASELENIVDVISRAVEFEFSGSSYDRCKKDFIEISDEKNISIATFVSVFPDICIVYEKNKVFITNKHIIKKILYLFCEDTDFSIKLRNENNFEFVIKKIAAMPRVVVFDDVIKYRDFSTVIDDKELRENMINVEAYKKLLLIYEFYHSADTKEVMTHFGKFGYKYSVAPDVDGSLKIYETAVPFGFKFCSIKFAVKFMQENEGLLRTAFMMN